MNTNTLDRNDPQRSRKQPAVMGQGFARVFTLHEELLADMEKHCQEITASPDTARAFLMRAGLLTSSGKPRQLIRG